MDLYSIGEMLIDFVPGREPGSYIRNAGGAPANLAIAAARNGLETAMCCSVGDDDFGRFLLATLEENGVRCVRQAPCREAVTTMAFITLSETGERSFTFARKPGADMFIREADVREADIRDDGDRPRRAPAPSPPLPRRRQPPRPCGWAARLSKLVSFDLNYRDMMWNNSPEACAAKVREVLPYVDLLKVADDEVFVLGGEEALPGLMERYGLTLVVETLGDRGAVGFFRGERIPVSGRSARCLDATGAGDAFWGGLLSMLRFRGVTAAKELTVPLVREAMAYGNVGGWLCIQGHGGHPVPAHPAGDRGAPGLMPAPLPGKLGIDKNQTRIYNILLYCKGASARRLR